LPLIVILLSFKKITKQTTKTIPTITSKIIETLKHPDLIKILKKLFKPTLRKS
jgi:hypothetical protein